jgi:hypothetical protein
MKSEYIKLILGFVEGSITVEDFWKVYQENGDFRKEILTDLERNKLPDAHFDPIEFLSCGISIQSYKATSNLHGIAKSVLKHNSISYTPTEFYSNRNRFLISIQPDWLELDADNELFLIELIESAPKHLSESQKQKWCNDKIKELFRYDSKPPQWVQYAEWPIMNGTPLVFKFQSKERNESELVKYFFYDPDTGEETVVCQYF